MAAREFVGRTTTEILDEIAAKLGPDALILGPGRPSAGSGAGLLGVTACRAQEAPSPAAVRERPSGLRRVLAGLARVGASDGLRGTFAEEVLSRLAPEALSDPGAVEKAFLDLLSARFVGPAPTLPVPGRVRRAALVGPSGAGKTTALLKLAGLLAGRTPLLRVGSFECGASGADRLAALTAALGVHVLPVTKPKDFRALAGKAKEAVLLLDTGGVGAARPVEVARLKTFLCDAGVTETHLVLPAGLDPEEARDLAAELAGAPGLRVLLAKLDEAAQPARLLGFLLDTKTPISYLGSGAGAVDALTPADASALRLLASGVFAARGDRAVPNGMARKS